MKGIPSTGAQVNAALGLAFGAFLGWLSCPLVWLTWGPLGWISFVLATSAAESDYGAAADSEAGSVGLLQFNEAGTLMSTIGPWAAKMFGANWRNSPIACGFLAAWHQAIVYIEAPSWLLLNSIPFVRAAAARWTWRHSSDFARFDGFTEAVRVVWSEFNRNPEIDPSDLGAALFRSAWWYWRGLTSVLALVILFAGGATVSAFIPFNPKRPKRR